jgi:uncharacterized membrane-anchored protein YhcB (DUF1043 family)
MIFLYICIGLICGVGIMLPFTIHKKKANTLYQKELDNLSQNITIKRQELDTVIAAINNSKAAQ